MIRYTIATHPFVACVSVLLKVEARLVFLVMDGKHAVAAAVESQYCRFVLGSRAERNSTCWIMVVSRLRSPPSSAVARPVASSISILSRRAAGYSIGGLNCVKSYGQLGFCWTTKPPSLYRQRFSQYSLVTWSD